MLWAADPFFKKQSGYAPVSFHLGTRAGAELSGIFQGASHHAGGIGQQGKRGDPGQPPETGALNGKSGTEQEGQR